MTNLCSLRTTRARKRAAAEERRAPPAGAHPVTAVVSGHRPALGTVAGLPALERATIARAVEHARRLGVPVVALSAYNALAAPDNGELARQQAFLDGVRISDLRFRPTGRPDVSRRPFPGTVV